MKRFLLLTLILLSGNIFACKCNTPTIKSSFESADFVFVGDVYDVNKTYKTGYWNVENALSKVKIEKVYKSKGNDFKSKEVTFFGQQFNSCDIIFTEKGKYLIFAYIDPDTTFFYSSYCLATKSLNEVTEKDFELLETLKKDYEKSLAKQNANYEDFSVELKTPDKIINELKLENKQASENNKMLKIGLIIVSSSSLLIIVVLIILNRRKDRK